MLTVFFGILKRERDVEDLQDDGCVLGVRGQYKNEKDEAREVGVGCVVRFGLGMRLLDGKALYVPRFDEGIRDDLGGRLEEMTAGLKRGRSRTAFFHPCAAAEMLEVAMRIDEFPGQAGVVVVDVFVNDVT